MSELGLWNPDKEPDKAVRPDMSGMGPNMSSQSLWKLAYEPDMSVLIGDFGGKIYFDVLHFTNSSNAPP
jgi:hypothetical protein